jgi:hypothetical protein
VGATGETTGEAPKGAASRAVVPVIAGPPTVARTGAAVVRTS